MLFTILPPSCSFLGPAPIASSKAHLSSLRARTIKLNEETRDSDPTVFGTGATEWQPAALAKVVDTLTLLPKEDYAADYGFDSFTLEGKPGTIKSYEGVGSPNVAWASGLLVDGHRAGITVFCGPLTDVPHLVVSIAADDSGIDLYIDFRTRCDAAYDPALATLEDYPDPTDRDMFAQGSNRKDLKEAFYTEEVEAWRSGLLALGTPNPLLSAEQTATISASPCLVDVRLPLSAAPAAADACTAAVDRWLGWMTSAGEMGRELPAGAKQTATYTRDTKVRANHFGFLLGRYMSAYGDALGKDLASADAGPLDEAYVGGGS